MILQQTRIDQGVAYFLRFMDSFPDVRTLAAATEGEVLRQWQGLGYYSRARNLHQAAREMVCQGGGLLPGSYGEWLAVKGVGPYTAAAIASMAFQEPVVAIDGNGYRVLSRIFALGENIDSARGKRAFHELASALLDPQNPGDFNQALMDFGSLMCKPVGPLCVQCLFNRECLAFLKGSVGSYPVRKPKMESRARYFHYFLFFVTDPSRFFIQKRTGNDIWKNLYELPLLETGGPLQGEDLLSLSWWKTLFPEPGDFVFTNAPVYLKHQLTHQTIHANFYRVRVSSEKSGELARVFTPSDEHAFEGLAKPRLIELFMNRPG